MLSINLTRVIPFESFSNVPFSVTSGIFDSLILVLLINQMIVLSKNDIFK